MPHLAAHGFGGNLAELMERKSQYGPRAILPEPNLAPDRIVLSGPRRVGGFGYTGDRVMNPLSMHPDNLATTKDDMIAFIAGHGMRRVPGHAGDDVPSVLWEDEGNPESWKDFVETAKAAGAVFVTMSEVVLEKDDLELLMEEMQDQEYGLGIDSGVSGMDEAQALVSHIGKVGHLQLGFPYQGVMFIYEASTEWYEHYQQLLDSVEGLGDIVFEDEDEDEEP